MTTQTQVRSTDEALQALIAEMEYVLSCINENKVPFDGDDFHEALRLGKEALSQTENDKERCVGCEACIDTACGRDECPKGWPKAAQPEQEEKLPPVEIGVDVTEEGTTVTAFYRRANDVMEVFYSQFYPLAQPAVAEQHKQSTTCGEPVAWRYKPARENNPRWEYTTEHPLDMGDGYLRPSLVEYCKCIEPLYSKEKPKLMLEKFREMKDLLDDTTPPQRKPMTDEQIDKVLDEVGLLSPYAVARAIEAAHGIKEKNT